MSRFAAGARVPVLWTRFSDGGPSIRQSRWHQVAVRRAENNRLRPFLRRTHQARVARLSVAGLHQRPAVGGHCRRAVGVAHRLREAGQGGGLLDRRRYHPVGGALVVLDRVATRQRRSGDAGPSAVRVSSTGGTPDGPLGLAARLERADQRMYRAKRQRSLMLAAH